MIYSDPPYNLKIDYAKGIGGKQNYGGNVNDNRSYEEYRRFIKDSLISALTITKSDCHIFYWSDQCLIGLIQELYRELNITNKRVCLWLKNSQNPTPMVSFNKCYEPAIYGVIGKPYITPSIQNLNEILNKELTTGNNLFEEVFDQLDIWLVKKIIWSKNTNMQRVSHPSSMRKAMRRCTRLGDIILDSFSGSGSTIIAGEQLKRKVYALELEPIFCDLTIKRYKKLTGKKVEVQHG